MANRATLDGAQALKVQMQSMFPNAKLTIVDRSKPSTIGRDYAIEHGLEITSDQGGALVTAIATRFDVLEVLACHECGSEVLTAAIGEIGNDECQDCRQERSKMFSAELRDDVAIEAQRVAQNEWRNSQAE